MQEKSIRKWRGRQFQPERHTTTVCLQCGTTFDHWISAPRKFCQHECSVLWRKRPIADRFWEKVNKDGPIIRPDLGPCWIWTAATASGYGIFGNGTHTGHLQAHAFSWELHYGPRNWLWVLHRCDNPPCVNPAHLFLGTHADNMRDMAAKGRHGAKPGIARYNPKLTAEDVMEIRRRSAETAVSRKALAIEYGVAAGYISVIVHGGKWKHLPILWHN